MKLRLQSTKNKTKSASAKKKAEDKELESIRKTLSSVYTDTSVYDHTNVSLTATQLRYGIVDSCIVDRMETMNGNIDITESWIEVLLILFSYLINNSKDTAELNQTMAKYKIANSKLSIDINYGKYNLSGKDFKAYKIPGTKYYMEIIDDYDTILDAVIWLLVANKMDLKNVKFHLMNKADKGLMYADIEEKESIVGLNKILDEINNGSHIVAMSIGDDEYGVHRIDVGMAVLCKWLDGNIDAKTLSRVLNSEDNKYCTVVKEKDSEAKTLHLSNSNIDIQVELKDDTMVKCMQYLLRALNFMEEFVQFKVKAIKLREEKHNYELDDDY